MINKKKCIGLLLCLLLIVSSVFIYQYRQKENDEKKVQTLQSESKLDKKKEKADMKTITLKINNELLTANLVDNSSTDELVKLLKKGPMTIQMNDYASMEKVGDIGSELPRNDEYITTEPGDLILYQRNQFVIYYESNSWNLTRLGKIKNIDKNNLKRLLGKGDVTVTLSIQE